jgi:Cu(I)/Ag(I) efflux system protein CusF
MKSLVVLSAVVAVSLAAIPLGRAQSGGMKGMNMKDMNMMEKDKKEKGIAKKSEVRSHRGAGTVEKVDSTAGTVTIAHGPIQSLKWPSMTMRFGVKDKAMLENVKPGTKVEFGFVQLGKDYLITEIK